MSTDGASSPSRLLPSLLGILLLLMGLAMLAGGIKLSMLGGSLYYLLAGIGLIVSGVLLLAGRSSALLVYGVVLFASSVWALWEVGLDWWQLVPRLSLFFALGVVLLLPWFRRPLLRNGPAPLGTAVLGVAVVLAGGAAINSQFTNPGEISGELGRESADTTSAAPTMPEGDWQAYGRTEFGDRYSPLTQITPANIGKLQEAWRIRTGDMPTAKDPVEITNQNTPLKVNGMLYACTAHSQVLALDPDTGKEIWRFDPKIQGPNGDDFRGWAHMTCRGVSYYDEASFNKTDAISTPASLSAAGQAIAASCPRRLFLPTADARLIAINADTGKVCEDFGNKGAVDLKAGIGPFTPGGYYSTSPAAITRNLVIIGGHVTDNESTNEPSGVIRAFDVHDGHLVWNWDAGNPDATAPLPEGQTYTRNSPNMWSLASVDEKLGLIYLPLGNQMPDQWGGNRTAGAEKFSAGTVALDIDTGKLRWNYQFTHHDLWDMDVGSQPTLVDMKTADGIKPALIQPTKQGSLYVLDRRDGTPIVPIQEVPAPAGAVEGDHTAPTQARSDLNLLPPPLEEKGMWGATPFDQMLCRIQFKELRYEGQYTPPSIQGSLIYPGNVGVFNWGSVSIDPVRHLLFTSPNYMAFVSKLVPRAEVAAGSKRESETSGVQPNTGAPYAVIMHPFMSPFGVPCQAPAWGYVAGIDLTTNKVVWKHKNGTSRDSSPVPIGLPIGVPSMGGSMVTAGGVGFLSGTLDQYIRGYDVNNGKELWKSRLPAGGQATPMSYTGKDGKQYVLVVVGGHGSLGTKMGDYIIAYKLSE
ncbi:glucose/quinate/shikimate family membrane-bound PQQ-dependent dehydrogenase [Pseudomonas chlororaphis]|uniref:glucose/quinate/shikimate family membrane-bound PQQ-dependent dehydrogenase n=1 Tax=Pseudomonas chlororaphis TaxID=587753 RepID=UPI0006A652CF|nr:glucose/quinate/shikimate family membrane-bound PQQ-dependent dehydrogenase [Pseudomonas chlororaphis]AZC33146.1 Glucose dehydrogenase, PQQ-dependent [Pseudomonas chlororaphis subsp. piscium]MBP5074343.1 glucose/quinate/shikimate family membrane-bound PQQ-dependent dehydrogenase [Pseudomonas chlororaphis]WDG76264.1 glucose/quinate/shikimate family membrane-bound PQQ-dependent dehydrogenase [Pseudomonas chlororaphis]WDG84497.1 glucose/quinate/shikimate family membrane-bound PQQ-dependent dehy